MSIETKIYNALQGLVAGRCYPNTLPQQPTYPAIAYQLVSEAPAASITQLARFTDFHFQITIHAADYATAVSLRSSVLSAAEAMPEYVTRDPGLEPPYEFEPKTFARIVNFHFRDAES